MGQKKYFADYIFHFIHIECVNEISQITPLTKAFRSKLSQENYYISQLKIEQKLVDLDGTVKYVFQLADGNLIETVLLFDNGRRTLCVSTQVGCAMNCTFCATGKLKFRRNLSSGEIVDQVSTIQKDSSQRITNIVYMGMGEPLNNYDAVLNSVRILNHPAGKNVGIRHLTISTCGIVPAIRKLADEDVHPRLAISLNAPTDPLRDKLMPINEKFPIVDLLKAVKNYQAKTRQRVSFEYVMINNFNDTATHARLLVKLLRGIKCHVNLIEHNPHRGCEFVTSPEQRIERFAAILADAGIETSKRLRMGQSINAACGQLGAARA
jgi:23S rRNA (adenine2503-C2)-methyltransferase